MQHFPLTEKLHTDILEEKYGEIHAKVIKHNSKIRESLLVDSRDISRTYALTFFRDLNSKELEEINEEIKKGTYISDGIHGVLSWKKEEKISPLKSRKNYLHPDIVVKNYKKALEIYYSNSFVKN